jgi:hypothetical protein
MENLSFQDESALKNQLLQKEALSEKDALTKKEDVSFTEKQIKLLETASVFLDLWISGNEKPFYFLIQNPKLGLTNEQIQFLDTVVKKQIFKLRNQIEIWAEEKIFFQTQLFFQEKNTQLIHNQK